MFGYELCKLNNEKKNHFSLQISQYNYKAVNTTTDSFSLRKPKTENRENCITLKLMNIKGERQKPFHCPSSTL